MDTDARREALRKAVEVAGTQAALAERLARRLGRPIRQSHVSNWLNRDDQVTPAEVCWAVEAETGVPTHDLRPDVFPAPSATPGAAAA